MPKKNLSDKAKKISLSLPESLEAKSREIAETDFGGNFSAFIQKLIENHLDHRQSKLPDATDPEALIKLFDQFLPPAKLTVETWSKLHKLQQNMFISQLLIKLNELQIAELSPNQILDLLKASDSPENKLMQAAELGKDYNK